MKVIGHNEKRFLKEFQSVKENGFCVHVQEVKDPNEEAQYVADEIEKRAELGLSYEEMAVLFRIHTDARPVAEEDPVSDERAASESIRPFYRKRYLRLFQAGSWKYRTK